MLHIISKMGVCLQDKVHIHDCVYLEHTVTKNVEILVLVI